jgi:hypothetical protein
LTDRLTLRGGYLFNTNPIPAVATLFNVQLPGIIENTLSFGMSFNLTDNIMLTGAWVHGFRNAIQGTILQERGAFTKFDTQYDSIVLGLNVQFGAKRRTKEISIPAVPVPVAVSNPVDVPDRAVVPASASAPPANPRPNATTDAEATY